MKGTEKQECHTNIAYVCVCVCVNVRQPEESIDLTFKHNNSMNDIMSTWYKSILHWD